MAADLKCYFLCCVLVHTLFITVNADVQVQCRNQTGILGKPLNLTCLVTCSENDCLIIYNKMYFEDQREKFTIFTCKHLTCYLAIPRTEVNHNGIFTFWVQTNRGLNDTKFTVTLVAPLTVNEVAPHTVNAVAPHTVNAESELHQVIGDNDNQMNGSSKAAMAIVLLILALALPTIALVALKKSQCGSELLGRLKNNVHSSQPLIV